MANNYNKSFNFNKGLQVDTNNFIVNSAGLVGIGTSIPKKYTLNVYGTTRVTGLTTTTELFVSGVSTFNSTINVGTGITMSNGIVSATQFYGDGSKLDGIVGYHTTSWILNTQSTGLSTTLNIGIGTESKSGIDLVVGAGISFYGNSGNINASGIITADGGFIGTIRSSDLRGTINDSILPNTITSNITGNLTGTASSATVAAGLTNTPNINVGVLTATNIVGTSLSIGIITSTSSLYLT